MRKNREAMRQDERVRRGPTSEKETLGEETDPHQRHRHRLAADVSGPHAGGGGLLLLADSIGIDRRSFDNGVAHPLREHMKGDALVHGMDGVAVVQALEDHAAYDMTVVTPGPPMVRPMRNMIDSPLSPLEEE